jgi:hypothetical protein
MNKTIILLAIATYSLGFVSCKDDEDDPATCSTNWAVELETETNAVINAATLYGNDPSAANCTNYKASYQAYINALKPYGNCSALTGQDRTEFNNALAEAEADLATLC